MFSEFTSARRELCICFFNDTPTTEIYTLSLHDALPIFGYGYVVRGADLKYSEYEGTSADEFEIADLQDRKSTRLNSSHVKISYAVFCLKKKSSPRTRSLLQRLASGSRYAHADEHSRRRSRRAAERLGCVRRDGPRGAQLGGIPRHRQLT